jgi:hypothetical protein
MLMLEGRVKCREEIYSLIISHPRSRKVRESHLILTITRLILTFTREVELRLTNFANKMLPIKIRVFLVQTIAKDIVYKY